jgi:hypothetical protein
MLPCGIPDGEHVIQLHDTKLNSNALPLEVVSENRSCMMEAYHRANDEKKETVHDTMSGNDSDGTRHGPAIAALAAALGVF